jgi:hypothetical protein
MSLGNRFIVTVICVNWGRGYEPGEFKENVLRVMKIVDRREHCVILPQELDEEPDPAKEHKVLNSMLEPGTKKVFWRSHEPIILSPDFKIHRRRRRLTMGSGKEIGGPEGTGPRRYAVTCASEYKGIYLGWGNTHPHRRMPGHRRVEDARIQGEDIFSQELSALRRWNGGMSGIWAADMNDTIVPQLVPNEKVAIRRGLDHMRYWEHPKGASLTLIDKGTLNGTIDNHDPLWARFRVEAA